ncbi:hypothetical protein [Streptomyces longispororuber]|uniref:hypothetical protein n=1 Tax=Streptomyces longispororuber TaxID=68230 RepID=UPI0036FF27B4
MPASRRITATALLSATVLALPAVGTAAADTNKSEQTSALSGPTAALLSPATDPSDNTQANRQIMDKAHTTNWTLVDYAGSIRRPVYRQVAYGAAPRGYVRSSYPRV